MLKQKFTSLTTYYSKKITIVSSSLTEKYENA